MHLFLFALCRLEAKLSILPFPFSEVFFVGVVEGFDRVFGGGFEDSVRIAGFAGRFFSSLLVVDPVGSVTVCTLEGEAEFDFRVVVGLRRDVGSTDCGCCIEDHSEAGAGAIVASAAAVPLGVATVMIAGVDDRTIDVSLVVACGVIAVSVEFCNVDGKFALSIVDFGSRMRAVRPSEGELHALELFLDDGLDSKLSEFV